MLLGADVLGAFEHHVLEKVSEAGASGALVGRTDVIPQVDGDERQAVILGQNDLKTVLQRVLFVLDLGSGHRRTGRDGQAAETQTECEQAVK